MNANNNNNNELMSRKRNSCDVNENDAQLNYAHVISDHSNDDY